MLDDDEEELLQHEVEGFEIEDDDEGDSAEIKAEDTSAIQKRYEVRGEPDFFHHKRVIPMSLSETGPQRVINDWALSRQKPIPFFGRAIKKVADRFSDFAVKSGYSRKTNRFEDHVLLHRPLHAMTEGGKGLTQNTRSVVMAHAGMSGVNNIIFGHGCPASCMFCKESLIARGFTEVAVSESSGVLHLSVDLDGGLDFSTPSKAKVKFWDSSAQVMVYGPISVAIAKGYPVSIDSIRKLAGKQLTRYLSD
jgi:hypothetical protein